MTAKSKNQILTLILVLIPVLFSFKAKALPNGSYQQSCRSVVMEGPNFRAQCRMANGNWLNTRILDYRSCRGDLWNNNGMLDCDNWGPRPPVGSYRNSCQDYWIENNYITAVCPNFNGAMVTSRLINYVTCVQDITNINGEVKCSKGGPLPAGSFQNSCQVYRMGINLFGYCQDLKRNWQPVTLAQYAQCLGDIQNYNGKLGCNKNTMPPNGSYKTDCPFIWSDGYNLFGECKKYISPDYLAVRLDNYKNCFGDIFFQGQKLVCSRQALPAGDYLKTCKKLYVENGFLYGDCLDRAGYSHRSAVNVKVCQKAINNDNGNLVCGDITPEPVMVVPEFRDMTLAQATLAAKNAGIVFGKFGYTCTGYMPLLIVKEQSPAPGTTVPVGTKVNISRCEFAQLDKDEQSSDCSKPTYMNFCASCTSSISGVYKSEVSGYSCRSEDDEKADLEKQFFGCTVKAEKCF